MTIPAAAAATNGGPHHKTETVTANGNHAAQGKTRIHRLIEEEGLVMLPGIYDGLSAAILQNVGFSAGFVSGYSVSAASLGKPDIGLLTPPEMAASTRAICGAADIPFIVDADTGGGSAINVHRTIKDLIAAGAAGCFLEDQAWPKKCGHMKGKQVIPAEEHAIKIRAARNAIGDADFFLVARTDVRGTDEEHGLDEAIRRANLYMDAGADACFVEAPRNIEELKEVARRTRGFKVVNMIEGGVTPLLTAQEFKDMGFHLMVHSISSLYASAKAQIDILKTLKETGTTKTDIHKLPTFEAFNKLIGVDSWSEVDRKASKFSAVLNQK